MSTPSLVNLPQLAQDANGVIRSITLYGTLVGEVANPSFFTHTNLRFPDYAYALLEVVGIEYQDEVQYAFGRVLVVVDRKYLERAQQKKSGRLAVKVSGAPLRLQKKAPMGDYLFMLQWVKMQNKWEAAAVDVEELTSQRTIDQQFLPIIGQAYEGKWQFSFPALIPSDYVPASYYTLFTLSDGIQNIPSLPKTTLNLPIHQSAPPTLEETITAPSSTNQLRSKSAQWATWLEKTRHAETKVQQLLTYWKEADVTRLSEQMIERVIEQFSVNWYRRLGRWKTQEVFKKGIVYLLETYTIDGCDTHMQQQLDTYLAHCLECWKNPEQFLNSQLTKVNASMKKVYQLLEAYRSELYYYLLDTLLETKGQLVYTSTLAHAYGVEILPVLKTNPYLLSVVNPQLPIAFLDKLARIFQIPQQATSVRSYRLAALTRHWLVGAKINQAHQDSTLVLYETAKRHVQEKWVVTQDEYHHLQQSGYVETTDNLRLYQQLFNPKLTMTDFLAPEGRWEKQDDTYVCYISNVDTSPVDVYTDLGLGVVLPTSDTDYLADILYAIKELAIYQKVYEVFDHQPVLNVSTTEIAQHIQTCEAQFSEQYQFAFSYEPEQIQAIQNVIHPMSAITGIAGSGKTTVIQTIVDVLHTLGNVSLNEFVLLAPTGKAARRLFEVLQLPTYTIHSYLRLAPVGFSFPTLGETDKEPLKPKVLIVDECSMITTDIAYELLSRIGNDTRVIFVGDIHQLPPIGKGKPFANLLEWLPVTYLTIPKRTSEQSQIAKNAQFILGNPNHPHLESGADMLLLHERSEDTIVEKIQAICRHHLYGDSAIGFQPLSSIPTKLSPDDIQVITPINMRKWGTVHLNRELQAIFNPPTLHQLLIRHRRNDQTQVEYRVGDRVMHTKSNSEQKARFKKQANGQLVLLSEKGITNGEVGKIVSVISGKQLKIEQGNTEGEYYQAVRKRIKTHGDYRYLVVAYNGIQETFYVFYEIQVMKKDGNTLEVYGHDLYYLDLAYAVTVHKLQGSEAPLTISVFLPVGVQGFISKNMLYPAFTRGKQGAYVLGDIHGDNSCIQKGKTIDQMKKRMTVLDQLIQA